MSVGNYVGVMMVMRWTSQKGLIYIVESLSDNLPLFQS